MKKIGVVLTLAVAFCFALVSVAQAGPLKKAWAKENMHNSQKAAAIPVWKITQDGTAVSVKWADHVPNPRFAVYDPATPLDETDDVVLDKETGLVWERFPSDSMETWYIAIETAYNKYLGGRKGWRLPTIEELASLVDPNEGPPTLPSGHPFTVQSGFYWSSTTQVPYTTKAWGMSFGGGDVGHSEKTASRKVWCVRGGQGHDAY